MKYRKDFLEMYYHIDQDIEVAKKVQNMIKDILDGNVDENQFDPCDLIRDEGYYINIFDHKVIDLTIKLIYHLMVYTLGDNPAEQFYSGRMLHSVSLSLKNMLSDDDLDRFMTVKYIEKYKDFIWETSIDELNEKFGDSDWVKSIPNKWCLPEISELIDFIMIDRVVVNDVMSIHDKVIESIKEVS